MLEAAVTARLPIINANNVVKRIHYAAVRILHVAMYRNTVLR